MQGQVEPIPDGFLDKAPLEFRRLFEAFNRMAEAVREREALSRQLVEEERLASLGRLASGMAHEINNPLGGLFNAIDTLKAHGERGDVRRRTIDLIERGLKGIRDVVRTTLVTYRADRDVHSLKRADVDDLRLLVEPEARRKRLTLRWVNEGYDELAHAALGRPAGAAQSAPQRLPGDAGGKPGCVRGPCRRSVLRRHHRGHGTWPSRRRTERADGPGEQASPRLRRRAWPVDGASPDQGGRRHGRGAAANPGRNHRPHHDPAQG